MKSDFYLARLVFSALIALLLTGCLSKRATVSTRHFMLMPIYTNEVTPVVTEPLSVGIGFVKMPSYLLRNSVPVRNSANEIEYIEDASWAERLDHGFQRTLAANLSRLLSSDRIYFGDLGRDQAMTRVSINVQQFDVDIRGHGTLIAHWRITAHGNDTPLQSGQARLARTGPSPGKDPEVIAMTLSELVAEFGRELAQPLRESEKEPHHSRLIENR